MDWENERYVRVYTRDTADLLAIGWQGRLVWYELVRKADRAGLVDSVEPAVLAEMLRIPREVIEVGLANILERRMAVVTLRDRNVTDGHATSEQALYLPNYVDAQEAKQSDKQRQRESRMRRRDRARAKVVTNRDKTTEIRSRPSHPVTPGHDESHAVTPSLAVPSLAVPDPARAGSYARAHVGERTVATCDSEAGRLRTQGELDLDALHRAQRMHDRLNVIVSELRAAGVAKDGPRMSPVPPKAFLDGCGLLAAAAAYTDADLEHVIAVRAAEARAKGTLKWLNPAQLWAKKAITHALGTSPEAMEAESRQGAASDRTAHAGISTDFSAGDDYDRLMGQEAENGR